MSKSMGVAGGANINPSLIVGPVGNLQFKDPCHRRRLESCLRKQITCALFLYAKSRHVTLAIIHLYYEIWLW